MSNTNMSCEPCGKAPVGPMQEGLDEMKGIYSDCWDIAAGIDRYLFGAGCLMDQPTTPEKPVLSFDNNSFLGEMEELTRLLKGLREVLFHIRAAL